MVPRKLLHPGEEVVIRTRRHPRALRSVGWVLVIVTIIAAMLGGFAWRIAELGDPWTWISRVAVVLVAVAWGLAVLRWVLRPLWMWATTHITLTNQRFFIQRGRTVQHIPVHQVTGVWFKPVDREQRSPGVLVLAANGREATFRNVPDVARVAGCLRREAAAAQRHMVMVPFGI